MTATSQLHDLADRQSALGAANTLLTDLDMQQSNSTIALNRALLATTAKERAHADDLLTVAADNARAGMAAITELDLPAEADAVLTALFADYEQYLSTEQEAMTAAKAADPAGPDGKKILADDDDRAAGIQQKITDTRTVINAATERASAETAAKATMVTATVVAVAVVLLAALGTVLVRGIRRSLFGCATG